MRCFPRATLWRPRNRPDSSAVSLTWVQSRRRSGLRTVRRVRGRGKGGTTLNRRCFMDCTAGVRLHPLGSGIVCLRRDHLRAGVGILLWRSECHQTLVCRLLVAPCSSPGSGAQGCVARTRLCPGLEEGACKASDQLRSTNGRFSKVPAGEGLPGDRKPLGTHRAICP
jgi:hypothetical protein